MVEENHFEVKLAINYISTRRICVQRLKRDVKVDSLKNNIKFDELKKLSLDYLPGGNKKLKDSDLRNKTGGGAVANNISNAKQVENSSERYKNYDVTITYFDEDGDEITVSSDCELVEALENLKITNIQSDAKVLYAYAIVKPEGNGNVPPFCNIRKAYMKCCAAQRARARATKMKNSDWHSRQKNMQSDVHLFREDKQLAEAIKMSLVTLAEEDTKGNLEKAKTNYEEVKDEQESENFEFLDSHIESDGKIIDGAMKTLLENKSDEHFQDVLQDSTKEVPLQKAVQVQGAADKKVKHNNEQHKTQNYLIEVQDVVKEKFKHNDEQYNFSRHTVGNAIEEEIVTNNLEESNNKNLERSFSDTDWYILSD